MIDLKYLNMVDALRKKDTNQKMEEHYIDGIWSEYGELCDAYKLSNYKELPLDLKNIKEELGDLVFYICAFLLLKKVPKSTILTSTLPFLESGLENQFTLRSKLKLLLNKSLLTNLNTILSIVARIAYLNGFTLQDVIDHNTFKLTDRKKGRYKKGTFSVEEAKERNDKRNNL